jgi:hypothetical protein
MKSLVHWWNQLAWMGEDVLILMHAQPGDVGSEIPPTLVGCRSELIIPLLRN